MESLAAATGGTLLLPYVTACGKNSPAAATKHGLPTSRPENWNAIEYNRKRGVAGAIPASYMAKINGTDGDSKHLGKHLPFIPELAANRFSSMDLSKNALIDNTVLPIMWGDPAKGHARHPNAPKSEANNFEGHWYNWIRIRKATTEPAIELQNNFANWPEGEFSNQVDIRLDGKMQLTKGGYLSFDPEQTDVTADSGKNTVYLTQLPKDVKKGDWIRVWAHCLTHGEYVDFLQVV